MGRLRDVLGQRFGRLEVVGRAENVGERVMWACRCECGAETVVRGDHLGTTVSCGCQGRERRAFANTSHDASHSAEYAAWKHAKHRCYNPRDKKYRLYGGRGITMCGEWRADFAAFLAHIGPRPSTDHSLGRIDGNRGYEPGNVRWETDVQQNNNTSRNRRRQSEGVTT